MRATRYDIGPVARFSRPVAEHLIRAGWFPERRVDPTKWSRVLDHP
jgi:hypothetical protein